MALNPRSGRSRQRPEPDNNDPKLWTVSKLKEELSALGIKIASSIPHKILVKLYLDNKIPDIGELSQDENNEAQRSRSRSRLRSGPDSVELTREIPSEASHAGLAQICTSGTQHPPNLLSPENQNMLATMQATAAALNQTVALLATKTHKEEEYDLMRFYRSASNAPAALGSPDQIAQAPIRVPQATVVGNITDSQVFHSQGVPAAGLTNILPISPELRQDIISAIPKTGPICRSQSNNLSSTGAHNLELNSHVNNLLKSAISHKTRSQYEIGLKTLITFCNLQSNVTFSDSLPVVNEDLLLNFISYCHQHLHLCYTTIKLYLCGIRCLYIEKFGVNPLEDMFGNPFPRLKYMLVAIKKSRQNTKRTRLPITNNILHRLCSLLDSSHFNISVDAMLKAAMTCAFFGFLRCGEFTVEKVFDSTINLSISDVSFFNDGFLLTLKKSKTDPFRSGITIPIYENSSSICPVKAMRHYLSIRGEFLPDDPLFIDDTGAPLTRIWFINKVKSLLAEIGYKSELYNGHSFRIGAATTCSTARIEDHLIQTLGRWSSNCYKVYIHTNQNTIKDAQTAMSKID